jgi:hypothetical protein
MPVVKKPDGWYWGSKGPFDTKVKALQVAQAAHASGFKEKREKNLLICIDYHHTYELDPKLWNCIINLFWLRKNDVICVSRDHKGHEEEILDNIGKVIGKKNVYFTQGLSKEDFCKQNDLKVDVWIDDNPKHILQPDE